MATTLASIAGVLLAGNVACRLMCRVSERKRVERPSQNEPAGPGDDDS